MPFPGPLLEGSSVIFTFVRGFTAKVRRNGKLGPHSLITRIAGFFSFIVMEKSGPRYFFKIFFPNQSSESMRIPPAFWKHIKSESGKRISLKGPSGQIWKIKLVNNSEGEFMFEDGWRNFVREQSLSMGDFLVFCYDGNSRFRVLLFDSTACEKRNDLYENSDEENDVEIEESEDSDDESEEEEEEEEESKPLAHLVKKKNENSLKRKKEVDDSHKLDSKIFKSFSTKYAHLSPKSKILLTPKQEVESYSPPYGLGFKNISTVQNAKVILKQSKRLHMHSAIPFRRTRVNTMINKMIKFRLQHGQVSRHNNPYASKMCTSKKSNNGMESVEPDDTERNMKLGSALRVGSLISRRRPVTEEEVKQTMDRALLFRSEHPFAIAVMQDSYVYTSFFMSVPAWFAKVHMPKENTKFTFLDPNGKRWEINYVSYGTHGAFSGGWGKFSHYHNLEKFDCCVFELVKQNEFKVHIYRVVEEIVPLVRRRAADAICFNSADD